MKLQSIEAARGIAALLVVEFHGERALALPQYVGHMPLGGVTGFMHTGVDFFFVLSGYIIFAVHRADIGRPAAPERGRRRAPPLRDAVREPAAHPDEAVQLVLAVQGVVRKMIGHSSILHVIHDIDCNEFTVLRKNSLGSTPGVLVSIEANVEAHTECNGVKRTELSSSTQTMVQDDHPFLARR